MRHAFRYPKLLLLAGSFLLAYVLFMQGVFDSLPQLLAGKGYLTMFFAGLLFTFGFTTPFAIILLIEMAHSVDPFLGAIVAGAGALILDLVIFEAARFSLRDELHRLAKTGLIRPAIHLLYHKRVSSSMRTHIIWSIAGFIIASPLPDEIGMTLLSGVGSIHPRKLAVFSFALNTMGIFLVIAAARMAM